MAKDEREEEEEFLAGLKVRTGRDLSEWMAAIAAQGLADRNAIIDWLRGQGLPFARASWLERIHNNAGKPIYSDAPRPTVAAPQPARPAPPPRRPAQQQLSPTDAAQLEKLIAASKGYRPLYVLLEEAIRNAIPAVTIAPRSGHVSIGAPAEFAALAPLSTELRLGLGLGPFDGSLQKPRIRGAGPHITHMLVLTDARQVDADLLALITTANARVNG